MTMVVALVFDFSFLSLGPCLSPSCIMGVAEVVGASLDVVKSVAICEGRQFFFVLSVCSQYNRTIEVLQGADQRALAVYVSLRRAHLFPRWYLDCAFASHVYHSTSR